MLRLIIVFNIAHNNHSYLFHEYPVIGELILCTIYIHCHVIHKIVNLFENYSECKHYYIHYYSTLSSEVTQRSIHFPRVFLFACSLIYYELNKQVTSSPPFSPTSVSLSPTSPSFCHLFILRKAEVSHGYQAAFACQVAVGVGISSPSVVR